MRAAIAAVLFPVAALALTAADDPPLVDTPRPTTPRPAEKVAPNKAERAALDAVNAIRTREGRSELKTSQILTLIAQDHADALARANRLDRTPAGKSLADRLTELAYPHAGSDLLAGVGPNSDDGVKAMTREATARASLLMPGFAEAGVGTASAASGTRYWVLVLAEPKKPAPPAQPGTVPLAPAPVRPIVPADR